MIAEKVAARTQARTDKDWAKADSIRDELLELNVEIMDSPEGTDWRIK
jgi:cysteinyl-tRNA synthetase